MYIMVSLWELGLRDHFSFLFMLFMGSGGRAICPGGVSRLFLTGKGVIHIKLSNELFTPATAA